MRGRFAILPALAALALASQARAGDATLRDLCPDRPTKGTAPCTVDRGHLQLEADIFDGAWDRDGGVSNDVLIWANPTLKFGVTDALDLEVNLPPLVTVRTHDDATGVTRRRSGIGDLTFAAKANLTGNRGDGWNLAVLPFLKAPVAHAPIGNGAWEGGVLLPLAGALGKDWSIDITPELDLVEDQAGGGHHAATAASVGLTRALPGGLSATGELWAQADFDPSGTIRQYSFDLALAWVSPKMKDLQLDSGVNLGLNRATPDVEAYVGVTRRF